MFALDWKVTGVAPVYSSNLLHTSGSFTTSAVVNVQHGLEILMRFESTHLEPSVQDKTGQHFFNAS